MKLLAWLYLRIGNLFYSLNGRLDGLDRDNCRRKIMYWAWGKAYTYEDRITQRKFFPEMEK